MSKPSIYAIPVLGRYGLAHGLLAWARCRLWCEQTGATMLAPFWLRPRIGPYLRRERDKRTYFKLFGRGNAVAGLRRLMVLTRARRIKIGPEWPGSVIDRTQLGEEPVLVCVHNAVKDNERKSFSQVIGHGAFLRKELLAMTRPRYRPSRPSAPFIAIHVRMGDFKKPSGDVAATMTNTRLPIDWYGDRLDALRDALGFDVRALVFSDGSSADLAPLLERPKTMRVPPQESVTDLLQIGHGVALIASGSGFSLWGGFLGNVPRLSYPGQAILPIYTDRSRDIEAGYGTKIPLAFVDHVRERLNLPETILT
ncbi:hypothetical protein [Erythrobacter sp. A6_0]|uniref:hypothetical protein n=1 Tax=Erythrobacter sp. A6_0 TaxID=2821089 RepID=UPI001ADA5873|nr:hypothetical protein [Erythrobacter sp. A6_0]MBO9511906.1 hypothetical protein [Erythrobacter sp. A6_0]